MQSAPLARAARQVALIWCAAGLVLPFATASHARADEARLQALESRLDQVMRRLERLESQAVAEATDAAPRSDDAIRWAFDASLREAPFNVTHQGFERSSGRLDLLLRIVRPIPDTAPWRVAPGTPVPVTAVLTLADGSASDPVRFRLARGPRLDPGSQLHLEAEVAPEQAAAVRGISVTAR